jgi:hypothetical protein
MNFLLTDDEIVKTDGVTLKDTLTLFIKHMGGCVVEAPTAPKNRESSREGQLNISFHHYCIYHFFLFFSLLYLFLCAVNCLLTSYSLN